MHTHTRRISTSFQTHPNGISVSVSLVQLSATSPCRHCLPSSLLAPVIVCSQHKSQRNPFKTHVRPNDASAQNSSVATHLPWSKSLSLHNGHTALPDVPIMPGMFLLQSTSSLECFPLAIFVTCFFFSLETLVQMPFPRGGLLCPLCLTLYLQPQFPYYISLTLSP